VGPGAPARPGAGGERLMLELLLNRPASDPVRVLALGAHPDDIEIGCVGTLLRLIEQGSVSELCWVVFSGTPQRALEAQTSAEAVLGGIPHRTVVRDFADGFFPYDGRELKEFFEELKRDFSPDVVFTHQRTDLHQDHRLTCELTWNTFRNHLILEYEIPKYDGDMGAPNMFVPLDAKLCSRKVSHLFDHFGSQVPKPWFKHDLFSGLLRLRGMECHSPTSYAEAFYCRKAVLA
jgi:LmbE family N-acetylglucosaminyl deacetylase